MKQLFVALFALIILSSCGELNSLKRDCRDKGGRWVFAPGTIDVDFCVDIPEPEPELEVIILQPGQSITLDNTGYAEFIIKGLGNFPVREFFLFNIAGSIAGDRTQSVHWLTYAGAGHFRIVEQAYNPVEETHHKHDFTFDPSQIYRMELTWSLNHLLLEMFVDGDIVATIDARFKHSFQSIDEVILGNGVFPGYPGLPQPLEVMINE